jgi:tetratricopeptide (TPR) repeat protein
MSAHFALQEGRNLIELKQNPILEEYFEHYLQSDLKITERSFEVVAGCFWDIVKTSSSYKGIGMAMQWVGLYKPAVKQLNKGLHDFTIDAFEQFLLLTNKGETLLSLAKEELGKEQKTQYMEESLQTLIQANELYHKLEEVSQDDEELRQLASFNFGSTAHAAALLGKTDLVLRSITNGLGTKASLPPATLNDVVSALKNVDQLLTIIDLLKLVPKSDITWYLVAESVEATQEAAVRTGQGQYLLDLYDAAQKVISAWPFGTEDFKARLQSNAAIFARQALGNLDVAKTLLRDMVNHPRTPTWRILEACNMLAEIHLEEFRLSKDPLVKKNALDETMKLFEKPAEVLPDSYNAAESHMIVTVALMLRRFGPALDLSDRLHAAFRNCIGELQDETGANDAYALRRLARVLSCLPGFEREARISLSAQLYVIDEDVHRKDLEQLQTAEKNEVQTSAIEGKEVINGIDAKDDLAVERDDQVAADSIDAPANNNMNQRAPFVDNTSGSTNGVGTAASNTEAITENTTRSSAVLNEIDEGLLNDSEFYCNFCIKETRDWSHGPTYLCIYCIDVDICEECFAKKIAREKGELEPDWRVICPQGHKHVKAPIEGWRGVRNGIMRIGTEEIPFKTWLVQLEVKWTKYWEEFWTEAETM